VPAVFTAGATLAPTLSCSCAKPSSKSALTGISTAAQIALRWLQTSSTVTLLSARAMVQAKPALVEASALKPRCCRARALPASCGLGIMKHPDSCSLRNAARLSADVSMISPRLFCLRREHSDARPDLPAVSRHDLAQKGALLREDEPVLLGKIEVRHAFAVGAQPRPIAFIGSQALERDQREGDVVGALMRHPVADEIAAAFRNDGQPILRILFEHRAFERVKLVANENGDGHENLRCVVAIIASQRVARMRARVPPTTLDCFASLAI